MKSHELYSNAECFRKYNATHVTNFKELSPYNINSYSCIQEIPHFMKDKDKNKTVCQEV